MVLASCCLIFPEDELLIYGAYAVAAAVNFSVIKSLLQKWASDPLASSEWYKNYKENYCVDVILENITNPEQITSLRHAELYLSIKQKDYIAIGQVCKNDSDTILTNFNDIGFERSVCQLVNAVDNIYSKDEL